MDARSNLYPNSRSTQRSQGIDLIQAGREARLGWGMGKQRRRPLVGNARRWRKFLRRCGRRSRVVLAPQGWRQTAPV
jgi:hypothetical protein